MQPQVNKIYLPKNEGLHLTRSVHSDRHSDSVNTNLSEKVDRFVERGHKDGWGQSDYKTALRGIISAERAELKSGNRMLNKNHRPWACPN